MCDDSNTFVVAIQEHWLRPDNLHLLNEVHPEFAGFGISSMSDRLGKQIYSGRPYGGVGFLWRKSCNRIRIGYKARSGRVLSISVELDSDNSISIASVYFPCFSTSSEYKNELSECLSDIEEILVNSCNVIVAGDTNFACDSNNEGYRQLSRLLASYQIRHCDEFIETTDPVTYYNSSLCHSSFIDHLFVSDSIRHDIVTGVILDSGVNLSDHTPLVYSVKLNLTMQSNQKDLQ